MSRGHKKKAKEIRDERRKIRKGQSMQNIFEHIELIFALREWKGIWLKRIEVFHRWYKNLSNPFSI